MDNKTDLVAFARDSAASGIDFYELLGVDGTTTPADIHRAWRRKGLQYHPDKAGADYDAARYEQFVLARDVLVDDVSRTAYDTARAAAAQRRLQSEQMSAERRRFKDELEAAEARRAAGTQPTATKASSEYDMLREAGRRRMAERQRRVDEAAAATRAREDARVAEIEQRLREREEDKARRRAERSGRRERGHRSAREHRTRVRDPDDQRAREGPVPAESASAWKALLQTEPSATATPIQEHPLFSHTLARLQAAGAAQRGDGQSWTPQWSTVEDPAVRRLIGRVPRFGQRVAADTS